MAKLQGVLKAKQVLRHQISENLQYQFRKTKLTAKEVSKKSGIPASTISSYRVGQGIPNAKNISLLAKAFHCQPEDISPVYQNPKEGNPVPDALRAIMIEEHKTIDQMAEDLGLSYSTVTKWVNGVAKPSAGSIYKISETYHVPVLMLVNDTHENAYVLKNMHEQLSTQNLKVLHELKPDMPESEIDKIITYIRDLELARSAQADKKSNWPLED